TRSPSLAAKSAWRRSCARTCGAGRRSRASWKAAHFPNRARMANRCALIPGACVSTLIRANLILVRHGQSQWNLENRFTGWWDVDLTDKGVAEAQAAGALLAAKDLLPTRAFTSLQTRAIRTLHLALEACGRLWIPETKEWRLNERHYGGLTGLDKAETAARHGEAQVKLWRRSFDVPPPAMEPGGPYDLAADPR